MATSVALLALAALAVLAALGAPPAVAADARFEAASLDGSVVFFSTDEAPAKLGDTDRKDDVYVRAFDAELGEYVTRKVSTGPSGGNDALDAFFVGASEDGALAFFQTREALVPEDRDRAADIYVRDLEAGTTALVSRGEAACEADGCGNAELAVTAVPRGITPDGSRAFFITAERLVAADTDGAADIYVRDLVTGTTELVSRADPSCGGCGDEGIPVLGFDDASVDGTKVIFRSEGRLHPDDGDDGAADIYVRDLVAGTTDLVSEEGDCGGCAAKYGASSADASHIVFETKAALDPADDDGGLQDVYEWTPGGGAALVSRPAPGCASGCGEPADATFPDVVSGVPGISADGERIVFETAERLVGADEDDRSDVYERAGGATTLVSRPDPSCEPSGCGAAAHARFSWISPDGSGDAILFETVEPLTAADTDQSQDVYRRLGGTTALVSGGAFGGSGEPHARFAGATHDGGTVFVVTPEQLAAADTDESDDVYAIADGAATLISAAQFPRPGNGPFGAGLEAVSADGSHAFFTTDEGLTVDDNDDGERDVYQRTEEGTVLVSTGNLTWLGPPPPAELRTDPPSPGASTEPRIRGEAAAGSSILVYAGADCSGEPLRSGTAEQLEGEGIAIAVQPGSKTELWLSAEADGITSECAGPLVYEHVGKPASGGGSGGAGGAGGSGAGAGAAGQRPRGDGRGGGAAGARYVQPRTRITFGPGFRTRLRKAVFRFTDETGQPGTRFLCRVDRRKWRRCGSPLVLRGLALGPHVVRVKGVNALGEAEPRPALRRFRVVRR